MSDQIPRDALIHDLAIVLAGSLHPDAKIGPAPRLAARRMQDVLRIPDGALVSDIKARLRAVLADDENRVRYQEPADDARYTLWKRRPGTESWSPAAHGTRDEMGWELAQQPPDSEWRWTVTGPGEQP